ncbi:hypothetical protein ID866_4976 [Astraeus odoratus]|nr:hypothetical protein ID866_4976 [Astraeus odoratus]
MTILLEKCPAGSCHPAYEYCRCVSQCTKTNHTTHHTAVTHNLQERIEYMLIGGRVICLRVGFEMHQAWLVAPQPSLKL